jgi:sodium transport system permease protein
MSGSVAPLRAAWSLARRDLLEFLRDRRTVVVTLLLPMVTYPLVALSSALGVRTALESTVEQQVATPLSLVLSGSEAPLLAARLGQLLHEAADAQPPEWPSDVFAEIEPPSRAEELLKEGKVDLWIDVPAGFTRGLAEFGTVSIEARVSDSQPADQKSRDQFRALITSLAERVRRERMEAAGVPLSLFEPIKLRFTGKPVTRQAVADRSVVAPVAGAILVLLAVLTMTGAFYPAIDAIAGEKERGTIETLLIVPCGAGDIVFGKFLAVFGVTLATLAANVVSILLTILVSLRFLPGASVGYYLQNIGGGTLITLLAFVGLSAVAAAMSLAVTTASKSVKEAQNTLTPVILMVSALAGVAIVPGIRSDGFVPAVPFAGQVVVSRTALTPPPTQPATITAELARDASLPQLQTPDTGPAAALLPLLVTLCSSGLVTLVLLRGTAAMLTDEEILFRGPDTAGGFRRPPRRTVPGVIHGGLALALGLAGLWYAQGLSPPDIVLAIPVQQLAVVLPLVVLLCWQRVRLRRTFALRWPGTRHGVWRLASGIAALAGGLLVGGGLFVLGAAALLRFGGIELSPAMRELSGKLLGLMLEQPWWLAWGLMAVLPACLEELLFRGWVLAAFTGDQPSRRRKIIAVVAQAACFAIFHLLPERMPQTFVLGLALGTIVLATGSLFPAILCHIANNSMPLLLLYGSGAALDVAASQKLAHEIGNLSVPPLAVALAAAGVLLGGLFIAWSGWLRQRGRLSGLVAGGLLVTLLSTPLAGRAADDTPAASASGIATPLRVASMPIKGLVEFVGDSPQG